MATPKRVGWMTTVADRSPQDGACQLGRLGRCPLGEGPGMHAATEPGMCWRLAIRADARSATSSAEVCTEGRGLCGGPRFSVPARAVPLYQGPRDETGRLDRRASVSRAAVGAARRRWPRRLARRQSSAVPYGDTEGAPSVRRAASLNPRAPVSLYRGARDTAGRHLVQDGCRLPRRLDTSRIFTRSRSLGSARGEDLGRPAWRPPPRLCLELESGSVPSPAPCARVIDLTLYLSPRAANDSRHLDTLRGNSASQVGGPAGGLGSVPAPAPLYLHPRFPSAASRNVGRAMPGHDGYQTVLALPDLHPANARCGGLPQRSIASSPVWQMGPKAPDRDVSRRDPRLLDFLASAKNAPSASLSSTS